MSDVMWKTDPEEHDYPAAAAYLALLAPPSVVDALIVLMKVGPIHRGKAKDILRASGLRLLPVDNPHVGADLHKITNGKKLSPVLLVRGDLDAGRPLQVADGYHRVCASYHTDENTDIPYRLATLADGATIGESA
jgi:hypothetical protein